MNTSIPDFIKNNYNVVYKSQDVDVKNFSNVDEFLLCDNHRSVGHSEINSLFINTFSNKDDVVLVEAIPSMQCIEKDEAFHAVWLTTSSRIVGWDTGTIEGIMGPGSFQQLGDLEIQGQILQRQLLDPNFSADKKELGAKLANVFEKAAFARVDYPLEIIAKTFPGRVSAMENSLVRAKEIGTRIFLIAGEYHLIQKETQDSRFSLGNFYEFLNARNAVILSPKLERVQEMGQNRNRIMSKVFLSMIEDDDLNAEMERLEDAELS